MPIPPHHMITPDDVLAADGTLWQPAEQLDTAASPQEASRLLKPVVAPDEGLLPPVSHVVTVTAAPITPVLPLSTALAPPHGRTR